MMQLQNILQYGWIGYAYIVSVVLFALIWAVVPAHLAVRLTKPQGRQHNVVFWSTYIVVFLIIAGVIMLGATQYIFSATF